MKITHEHVYDVCPDIDSFLHEIEQNIKFGCEKKNDEYHDCEYDNHITHEHVCDVLSDFCDFEIMQSILNEQNYIANVENCMQFYHHCATLLGFSQ